MHIVERDGPFKEFKPDAFFVSVKLTNTDVINNVLVLYPNIVAAVKGEIAMLFECAQIETVFQTDSDLHLRSKSDWVFFGL